MKWPVGTQEYILVSQGFKPLNFDCFGMKLQNMVFAQVLHCLYTFTFSAVLLMLKVAGKTVADDSLILIIIFQRKKGLIFNMYPLLPADDSMKC